MRAGRTDRRDRLRQEHRRRRCCASSARSSSTPTRWPARWSRPGTPGLAAVVEAFGAGAARPPTASWTGRRWARWCSPTRPARRRLEAIIHPLVFERERRARGRGARRTRVVVHDIPLLARPAGPATSTRCSSSTCPTEVQVERMVARPRLDRGGRPRPGSPPRRRARSGCAIATYVIDNTGTREDLRQRVAEVFAELTGRLTRSARSRVRRRGQAARSGSARRRSFCSASRSSWRTRSAEMPCLAPMSASLCWRPSSRP